MSRRIRRLTKRLLADRKKASFMLALLALALLLWGRLLLNKVPRIATAEWEQALATTETEPLPPEPTTVDHPMVRVALPQRLGRDVFDFDASRYRRIKPEQNSEDQSKSAAQASDEISRSQLVLEAAEALTLQSVLQGRVRRAVINGRVLAVGETIEGFEVKAVETSHVLVEKEGILVRLRL